MAKKCMLTTIDNPFDPFEQFTSWLLFDEEKGYHSCSYLGRIARTSDCKIRLPKYLQKSYARCGGCLGIRWYRGGVAKIAPPPSSRRSLKIPRGYFSENVFTSRQYLTELIRLAK